MYNLLIGGAAGQGIETTATILRKALKKSGYHIFTVEDVMSRVRGGHNFSLIRFGSEDVLSHSNKLDGIIALNDETIELHKDELNKNGFILCDSTLSSNDPRTIKVDMNEMAKEIGNPKVSGSIAVGAVLKLFGEKIELAGDVLKDNVKDQYLEMNIKAMEKGFQAVEGRFPHLEGNVSLSLMINGNQALSLGAMASGLKFYAAYPMSPSTSIMEYLASKSDEAGIVVEQAEDEIAAINMAIGASFAGVRSMTGTSGGGFSLMVEALGLAGMAEIPLVVVDVQRPGPATGFPTRTEQSDLKFVVSASQGEFPRMVIALRNHTDAFYQTARALNLAEKYQIPVIILSDQYLSDSHSTVEPYDLKKAAAIYAVKPEEKGEYLRYKYTEDGISPRLIPGKTNNIVAIDSDEHDERGWITESSEVRIKMMDKRMRKLEKLKLELQEPEFFGDEAFKTLLVGWGSTEGPIKEAVESLNRMGKGKFAALVFGDIYPLPQKLLREKLALAERLINVEQNATGQLADLIREQTGISCDSNILKYDGRQISGEEITERILKEVQR
ncbi:MAG: 2-oxoacid:acceptor oxidoreductase subunit alpha [Peptostreptococcaceae bacterium]|nr:2-oxoacid:acceptor oxidoreductase subunit alpha [Peptostreptococcaceae bacterium]